MGSFMIISPDFQGLICGFEHSPNMSCGFMSVEIYSALKELP
jgi:hypothetical protein